MRLSLDATWLLSYLLTGCVSPGFFYFVSLSYTSIFHWLAICCQSANVFWSLWKKSSILRLHSMPSEINEFTKNITFYPQNKTCKKETESQISLYVLIIQEKQKKIVCAPSYFDIEMLVFSLMDTAKINKDTPKTPFESMQPTTMLSSNTIRCSYCVISFFSFFFIIECPC